MAVELATKYTGKVAATYESKRHKSLKWKEENKAVAALLGSISCETLLDVAAGTGRFVSLYESMGIQSLGLDISQDMLVNARHRGMNVVCGDILTYESKRTFDVVLCVRLLNWFDKTDMAAALVRLSMLASEHVIISLTTSIGRPYSNKKGAFMPSLEEFSAMICNAGLNIVNQYDRTVNAHCISRVILLEKSRA